MTRCHETPGYPAGPPHRDARRRRIPLELRERPVRSDSLPEQVDYRDQGCDLFPSCLRCPLPRCRYDEPGGVRAMLNRIRDREIRRLRREEAVPIDEIAKRFRVSRRTVFRALRLGPATAARVKKDVQP